MRPRENLSYFRISYRPVILVVPMAESLNLTICCVKFFINKKASYPHKQNATEESV